MKGFTTNIETVTLENRNFRRVLYTGKHSQLVLMNLMEGEEIGNEIHESIDQFIRVEQGRAKAVLNNGETQYDLSEGEVVIIPAGTWHNIVNSGKGDLKIYTLYSPPAHKDGTVVVSKTEAVEEHFDGKTTE